MDDLEAPNTLADPSDHQPEPSSDPTPPAVTAAAGLATPWLDHYAPAVPRALDLSDQSLSERLDAAANRFGARTALVYYGTRISYQRLGAHVDDFARALAKLGVRPGDRVAICLPNLPQFPIAFFGALKAGAVVVPTNPLYTGPELRHQLTDAGARVIVTLDQLYPTLASVRAQTPVEHVIVAGVADYFPRPLALLYGLQQARATRGKPHFDRNLLRTDASIHDFASFLRTGKSAKPAQSAQADFAARGPLGAVSTAVASPAGAAGAQPNDLAVLQYTGGTTGVSKGAMLTHRNLAANAMQTWLWSEQVEGSQHVMLCVAPFFHVYGLTVGMTSSLFNGCTLVLMPRFSAGDVIKAIEKYKPDLFPGVPTMYLAIATAVEQKRANLSSVKVCISGAAPLPAEVQSRFERLSGARVVEGYGLTEASPVTHCNPVFGERRTGTIGLPVPGTEAAIVKQDTFEFLPPGEIGEIVVRGPQVMAGYWQRPDESAKALHDGWLRTGDIGQMAEDGYFKIVDRAKDLIIAGGYNIYPRDVEEVLYQQPEVLEATVVGIPDQYRGETVRAYVVVKPGHTLSAETLDAFCRERLAAYKVPREYEFRAELPKTLIGKVLRRALREEAAAQADHAAPPADSPAAAAPPPQPS